MMPQKSDYMKSKWSNLLDRTNDRIKERDPAAKDPLAGKSIITPLMDISVVHVSGDDATAFLDSQLTSDIKNLADKKMARSGYCNPKGRLIATPYIFRDGDNFNLLLPDDLASEFVLRLSRFILRAKVKLVINEKAATIGFITKEGMRVLPEINPSSGSHIMPLNATQAILVCPFEFLEPLWEALTVTHTIYGEDLWRLETIRNGIVNIGDETKEQFLPQMINLDKGDGVSFTKGCYPGQEIVARTKYLGSVKRKLCQFKSNIPLGAGTALLNSSGTTYGLVCDSAPSSDKTNVYEGLAVVQSEHVHEQHLTTQNSGQIEELKVI
jgi:folate-binding protein YgfZ|tara:strand:+ start:4422 stop:5396 length:975 start_codon:yes stop_codon:yes gene_type:complete